MKYVDQANFKATEQFGTRSDYAKVHVARRDVARIIKELYPDGRLQRRSRRLRRQQYTSFCWHAEG